MFFSLTLSVLVTFCPYVCVLISRAGMLKETACAFVKGYLNYAIEAFTDTCNHWKRATFCGNCIIFYSFAVLIGCIDFILLYATELVSFLSCCSLHVSSLVLHDLQSESSVQIVGSLLNNRTDRLGYLNSSPVQKIPSGIIMYCLNYSFIFSFTSF